jgi:hypothetical protein
MSHSNPKRTDRGARRLAVAAALLALLVAGPDAGPRVGWLSGQVEIGRGEPPVWQPAQAGDPLAAGDAVRTGHDGRAELELGRGTVRLYGNSLLRLPQADMGPRGAGAVELEQGHSLFDVLHRDGGEEPFEVRSREVVVSVKGTRFSVGADAWVEVSVYRGLVGVSARDAERVHETLVREGFAALGGPDRPFELFLHEGEDPWDAWSPDALPQRLDERARSAAPPARLALDAAEQAARRAYRPEALGAAMERRPEVAERVARLAEEQATAHREGDGSKLEPTDPVLDAPLDVQREAIEVPTLEAWLGSQDPDGSLAFDLSLLSGSGVSGSDQLLIESQTGSSWTLDQGTLDSILDGQSSLPTSLESELLNEGVTDLDGFVRMLAQVLDGR